MKKFDRLKNDVIRNKTKAIDNTVKMRRLKWRWAGHMPRSQVGRVLCRLANRSAENKETRNIILVRFRYIILVRLYDHNMLCGIFMFGYVKIVIP